MFGIKKLFSRIKARFTKSKIKAMLSPRIVVVYSQDSMVSIAAAGLLRDHVQQHHSNARITFIELGDFQVREPVADVYFWLDLPRLDVVEDPKLEEGYKKAQHFVLRGNGSGPWGYPAASRFADSLQRVLRETNGDVTLCSEHTRLTRSQWLDARFDRAGATHMVRTHIGIIINAVLAMEAVYPSEHLPDDREAFDKLAWRQFDRLSEIEHGILAFTEKETTLGELLGLYKFTKAMLVYISKPNGAVVPELEYRAIENNLMKAFQAGDKDVVEFQEDLAIMQHAVFMNGVLQNVYVKTQSGRKVATLLTTRIQNNFWMARRLIRLAGKGYHNTRMTVTGHHVSTDARGEIADLHTTAHHTRA